MIECQFGCVLSVACVVVLSVCLFVDVRQFSSCSVLELSAIVKLLRP